MKKVNSIKCWQGCREFSTLVYNGVRVNWYSHFKKVMLFSGQVKEGTHVLWPNYSTPGCIPRVRHIHIMREKNSSKMRKSFCHSMDSCQEHHIEEQNISC